MIEVEARLRRWGRSFGVVVPMDKIKEANFREDEMVDLVISKRTNLFKKHFGTFKFKRPINEILKEGDKESWDE